MNEILVGDVFQIAEGVYGVVNEITLDYFYGPDDYSYYYYCLYLSDPMDINSSNGQGGVYIKSDFTLPPLNHFENMTN